MRESGGGGRRDNGEESSKEDTWQGVEIDKK